MRKALFACVIAAAAVVPAPGSAQVAWESSMMMGPGTSGGLSLLLLDGAGARNVGFLGIWRPGPSPGGMGIRGGVAEDVTGELAIFGGVDFSDGLARHSQDFPLDLMWLAGAGASVSNGEVMIQIPGGVSMGRVIRNDRLQFTPYVAPRLILDVFLGDERAGEDLDLSVAVDLGFDIAFASSWTLRFGSTVGDHDALLIGAAFGPNR